jgi:ABC-type Fe3+/spermidine/putrescine transport system ATPase subunit
MAAIRLHELTKRFGRVVAVNHLSLQIQEGELITLLGPSGCGKTTTLRIIGGFEHPDGGEVFFGDRAVTGLPPERRDIGIVFQNYALFPHLTVNENVAFGLDVRGVPRAEIAARVAAILDKVQLGGLGGRYPHQLSGGQQQRTALARALVINPQVLLLDEPLANLDAKLREEMRFYIRHLQREFGITTVYVTHDQAEAMVLADRIVVLRDGVLQQLGAPDELYRRPRSAWVADFIGLSNFIRGTAAAQDGRLVVRTAVGTFEASGGAAGDGARDVLVVLRPEALHFGGEYPNRLAGIVRERAFLGNLLDYRIECAPDVVLRVQADPSRRYEPGARVELSFAAGDAWTVPAGEAG